MATEYCRQNVHQKSQVWCFLFLTICFTLCGAGACSPLDMGGGGQKKWVESLAAGNSAMKAGDYAAAETSFVTAEKLCAKDFGKDDPRRATCLAYLAEMYRAQQEYRKAALIYKELIEIKEKTDPKSADLANFRAQYGEVQRKIKDYNLDADPNSPKAKAKAKSATEGKNHTAGKRKEH